MLIGACNLTLCARFHGAPPIQVVGRIKAVVTGLWPYAEMNIFGSVAAGIFLPTSDIDMVIQGKWATLPLQTLVQRLRLQFPTPFPLLFFFSSFLLFFFSSVASTTAVTAVPCRAVEIALSESAC